MENTNQNENIETTTQDTAQSENFWSMENLKALALSIFSLKGRMSGLTYLKYYSLIIPISLLMNVLALPYQIEGAPYSLGDSPAMVSLICLVSIFGILALVLAACADVKRFHDFNISGYFVIAYWVVQFVLGFIFGIALALSFFEPIITALMAFFTGALFSILTTFIVALIPSTKGANKFGENPNE